jgi:hypothetical protein
MASTGTCEGLGGIDDGGNTEGVGAAGGADDVKKDDGATGETDDGKIDDSAGAAIDEGELGRGAIDGVEAEVG